MPLLTDDEIRALLDGATPGPWAWDDRRGWAYLSGGGWIQFARVAVEVDDKPNAEGQANARLIAAAPSLAAEVLRLREALREIQQMRVLAVPPWTHEKAADTYSAAIDAVKHIARAALKGAAQ